MELETLILFISLKLKMFLLLIGNKYLEFYLNND